VTSSLASRLKTLERTLGVGVPRLVVIISHFVDAPLSGYVVDGETIDRTSGESEEALEQRAAAKPRLRDVEVSVLREVRG